MKNSVLVIISLMLLTGAVHADAQICDHTRDSDTLSGRFDINNDGTVTDIVSGLTWMRCALGQHWNGSDCEGNALLLSWGEAMVHVQDKSTSTSGGNMMQVNANEQKQDASESSQWRVPRLNELAGITDLRCHSPRIDLALFPNTAASAFWTTNSVPGSVPQAFTLSFGREGVAKTPKQEKHFVRLVKGRD